MQVPLARRRSETADAGRTTEDGEIMGGMTINIAARGGGGEFDCYIVTPEIGGRVPAVVLASAVHGVDEDIRAIADELQRTDLSPQHPTCSGVRSRARSRVMTNAP